MFDKIATVVFVLYLFPDLMNGICENDTSAVM